MFHLPFFKKKKPHFTYLSEKWKIRNQEVEDSLWKKHGKYLKEVLAKPRNLAVSSLAGAVLMVNSHAAILNPNMVPNASESAFVSIDKQTFLMADLSKVLPSMVQPLTSQQENAILDILSNTFNLPLKAEINGIRLDRNYGLIGKEQHLARFPGDNISTHFETVSEANKYADTGMAPGLGAWGYFSASQETMTNEDILREKYYIAVPTFLAPGYNENVNKYNSFFKYQKMLVVNPDNGKAIVADIADSGPSPFTGKNLGGSPEVMDYLKRFDGAQKGPVLYFFINDPNDKIPLGPINIK